MEYQQGTQWKEEGQSPREQLLNCNWENMIISRPSPLLVRGPGVAGAVLHTSSYLIQLGKPS